MKIITVCFLMCLTTSVGAAFPEEDEIEFRNQLKALVPWNLMESLNDEKCLDQGIENIAYLQRKNPAGRQETLTHITSLSEQNRILLFRHYGHKVIWAKL